MPKVSTAEWILSLVMTPGHAAATAGDLLELSAAHSPAWFWSSVLRVFSRSLAAGVGQRPGAVLGAALAAFLMQFLLPLPFALLIGLTRRPSVFVAAALCVVLLTQYTIGRAISRFSRATPASVCLVMALMNGVVGACHVNIVSINLALWQFPVLFGVLVAHRRSRLALM
jgi:hypothetical protein